MRVPRVTYPQRGLDERIPPLLQIWTPASSTRSLGSDVADQASEQVAPWIGTVDVAYALAIAPAASEPIDEGQGVQNAVSHTLVVHAVVVLGATNQLRANLHSVDLFAGLMPLREYQCD